MAPTPTSNLPVGDPAFGTGELPPEVHERFVPASTAHGIPTDAERLPKVGIAFTAIYAEITAIAADPTTSSEAAELKKKNFELLKKAQKSVGPPTTLFHAYWDESRAGPTQGPMGTVYSQNETRTAVWITEPCTRCGAHVSAKNYLSSLDCRVGGRASRHSVASDPLVQVYGISPQIPTRLPPILWDNEMRHITNFQAPQRFPPLIQMLIEAEGTRVFTAHERALASAFGDDALFRQLARAGPPRAPKPTAPKPKPRPPSPPPKNPKFEWEKEESKFFGMAIVIRDRQDEMMSDFNTLSKNFENSSKNLNEMQYFKSEISQLQGGIKPSLVDVETLYQTLKASAEKNGFEMNAVDKLMTELREWKIDTQPLVEKFDNIVRTQLNSMEASFNQYLKSFAEYEKYLEEMKTLLNTPDLYTDTSQDQLQNDDAFSSFSQNLAKIENLDKNLRGQREILINSRENIQEEFDHYKKFKVLSSSQAISDYYQNNLSKDLAEIPPVDMVKLEKKYEKWNKEITMTKQDRWFLTKNIQDSAWSLDESILDSLNEDVRNEAFENQKNIEWVEKVLEWARNLDSLQEQDGIGDLAVAAGDENTPNATNLVTALNKIKEFSQNDAKVWKVDAGKEQAPPIVEMLVRHYNQIKTEIEEKILPQKWADDKTLGDANQWNALKALDPSKGRLQPLEDGESKLETIATAFNSLGEIKERLGTLEYQNSDDVNDLVSLFKVYRNLRQLVADFEKEREKRFVVHRAELNAQITTEDAKRMKQSIAELALPGLPEWVSADQWKSFKEALDTSLALIQKLHNSSATKAEKKFMQKLEVMPNDTWENVQKKAEIFKVWYGEDGDRMEEWKLVANWLVKDENMKGENADANAAAAYLNWAGDAAHTLYTRLNSWLQDLESQKQNLEKLSSQNTSASQLQNLFVATEGDSAEAFLYPSQIWEKIQVLKAEIENLSQDLIKSNEQKTVVWKSFEDDNASFANLPSSTVDMVNQDHKKATASVNTLLKLEDNSAIQPRRSEDGNFSPTFAHLSQVLEALINKTKDLDSSLINNPFLSGLIALFVEYIVQNQSDNRKLQEKRLKKISETFEEDEKAKTALNDIHQELNIFYTTEIDTTDEISDDDKTVLKKFFENTESLQEKDQLLKKVNDMINAYRQIQEKTENFKLIFKRVDKDELNANNVESQKYLGEIQAFFDNFVHLQNTSLKTNFDDAKTQWEKAVQDQTQRKLDWESWVNQTNGAPIDEESLGVLISRLLPAVENYGLKYGKDGDKTLPQTLRSQLGETQKQRFKDEQEVERKKTIMKTKFEMDDELIKSPFSAVLTNNFEALETWLGKPFRTENENLWKKFTTYFKSETVEQNALSTDGRNLQKDRYEFFKNFFIGKLREAVGSNASNNDDDVWQAFLNPSDNSSWDEWLKQQTGEEAKIITLNDLVQKAGYTVEGDIETWIPHFEAAQFALQWLISPRLVTKDELELYNALPDDTLQVKDTEFIDAKVTPIKTVLLDTLKTHTMQNDIEWQALKTDNPNEENAKAYADFVQSRWKDENTMGEFIDASKSLSKNNTLKTYDVKLLNEDTLQAFENQMLIKNLKFGEWKQWKKLKLLVQNEQGDQRWSQDTQFEFSVIWWVQLSKKHIKSEWNFDDNYWSAIETTIESKKDSNGQFSGNTFTLTSQDLLRIMYPNQLGETKEKLITSTLSKIMELVKLKIVNRRAAGKAIFGKDFDESKLIFDLDQLIDTTDDNLEALKNTAFELVHYVEKANAANLFSVQELESEKEDGFVVEKEEEIWKNKWDRAAKDAKWTDDEKKAERVFRATLSKVRNFENEMDDSSDDAFWTAANHAKQSKEDNNNKHIFTPKLGMTACSCGRVFNFVNGNQGRFKAPAKVQPAPYQIPYPTWEFEKFTNPTQASPSSI